MSPRKTRDLEKGLRAKGFQQDNTHHRMHWLYVAGKRTAVRTRISHGQREYGESLLGWMARELGLRRTELDDLIDCPISEADYVGLLRERGKLRPPF